MPESSTTGNRILYCIIQEAVSQFAQSSQFLSLELDFEMAEGPQGDIEERSDSVTVYLRLKAQRANLPPR